MPDVPCFSGHVFELVTRAHSANNTDTAMGIALVYFQIVQPLAINGSANINFGTPYFAISLSLTVIVTIMIILKLVLHNRRIRRALGASTKGGGLYTAVSAIVATLVESYALYAVNFLLFVGPWGANNYIANIFFPILIQTQVRVHLLPLTCSDIGLWASDRVCEQVIAPFLIILRVANRTALTGDSTSASGNVGSIQSRSQGKFRGGAVVETPVKDISS